MSDAEKTVFISYRRDVSSYIARAIFLDLRANGYDVFMDVESIDSGTFDTVILNQIEARGHFVLVLTPGSVERCAEDGDWLRREIEYAMEKQRNVVPVLANGFTFSGTEQYLTQRLTELHRFNALPLYHEYFDEGMSRLRNRFLKQPVYGEVVAAPTEEHPVVEQKIEEAANQAVPTEEQLGAEEYSNRAAVKRRDGDLSGAIADYSHAIRLDPRFAYAYYCRGRAMSELGDFDNAIASFTQAIRLNSQNPDYHLHRGLAHHYTGKLEAAIADYTEALRLDPQDALNFKYRAEAHFALKQFDRALSDFQQVNNVFPAYNMILVGLAITHHALGQNDQAIQLWETLITQDSRYKDADWVGKELNWAAPLTEEARKLVAKL
jgi:tetratricopeptide (TPR) repeat protein